MLYIIARPRSDQIGRGKRETGKLCTITKKTEFCTFVRAHISITQYKHPPPQMELTPGTSMEMRYCTGNPNSAKGLTWRKITIITAPFDKPGYEQGPVVEVDDSGQFKVFYIDRILETRPLSRRGLSLKEGDLVAIDASRTVENIGYGTVVALHRDNTATIKPQISRRRVRVPVDAVIRKAKGLIAKRRRGRVHVF